MSGIERLYAYKRKHNMIYLTQSVHRNAQIYPNQLATVCQDRSSTWTQLKTRVASLAAGLKAMGIQDNDRLAILSMNSDRYLEYYFAVPWAGACVVPLNIRWSAKENLYSLKDAGARVLFVDDTFMPLVPALKEALDHVIYIGDNECPEGMVDYEGLIRDNAPMEDSYRHDSDLAGIFYTGGTTGFPKGVMLTHISIWTSSLSLVPLMEMSNRSSYLHAAPMFHLADEAVLQAGMLSGATHYFIPSFTPQGVVDTLSTYKICLLYTSPSPRD